MDAKNKGTPKSVIKKCLKFDHYKQNTENKTEYQTTFINLRSRQHEITRDKTTKLSLSSFDDKRFILDDGSHGTLAWGHRAISQVTAI